MSIRSRLRVGEVALALLSIAAVVGLGLYAAPSGQTGRQSTTVWSKPGGLNASLAGAPRSRTAPIFGANVRANSDATSNGQHEPSLAVSRVHTNTVVVASKDYRNGNQKEVWIDVSTDGGATWPVGRQLQMPGVNAGSFPHESDPVVIARDDGRIYVACLGYDNQNAVFITWTDDDGATWHNPSVQVSPTDGALDDKDWFAVDNTPGSPYYHRMYMMYAPGAGYVVEQHSTDGGLTWSPRQTIGASNTEYTYPVIGSDGTVYNFMMLNWGAGQQGTIQLTKSTNGGASWSPVTTVATAQQPNTPIRGSDQFRFFAIISAAVDPNNGNLYVAWTDNRNFSSNGTDVLYVKSTDGGTSWSAPTRLSHDPTGVVRDHITPVLTVGSDSTLHAFWLDRRLDANNKFFDSWYNSSTDGGVTWDGTDTRVTTQSQDLNVGLPPGSGGAAGDYWGIDTARDAVYVAWNDTRNGIDQDIYVAKGLLSDGGGRTATPTSIVSATPTNTLTNTPTPTASPSLTPTSANNPTNTPSGTITVATNTPSNTSTPTVPLIPTITSTHTSTSTPTSTPLSSCDPVWRTVTLSALPGNLFGVSGTSRANVWAVGNGGIFHWGGADWTRVSFPMPPLAQSVMLYAVSALSPGEAWAVGAYVDIAGNQQSVVYRWDGTEWSLMPVAQEKSPSGGTLNYLYGVAVLRPGVAFAVGQSVSGGYSLIYRCEVGTGCAPSPHPSSLGGLHAVWASGTGNAWAVGDVAMHYDSNSWSVVSTPNVGVLRGVWGSAPDDVRAVGDGGSIHWDGSTWSQDLHVLDGESVWGSGADDVWVASALNGGEIWHWDGANWTLSTHLFGVTAIWSHAPDDVWAAANVDYNSSYIGHYGPSAGFTDVPPSSTFFTYVEVLYCKALISGYPCGGDGEPCDSEHHPYFRTNNNVTRGQLSKIVSGAAGFSEPVSGQMFEDVAPGSTFYTYTQRLASRSYMNGYPCGGPREPCVPPNNRPYFRPNNNSTRGQISKIVSNAAGFNDPPGSQIFEDVPPGSTFYDYIQRLASRGVMQGYPCGGSGEPCNPPGNREYFHPNNNATRGQTSKIVSNTFFP